MYGTTYECDHPIYSRCTLFTEGKRGIAIIQQRYDLKSKCTWWSEIDPWLTDSIYLNLGFKDLFDSRAGECMNGLYPTITLRQIMWALKMKPLKKERWETCFDRKAIWTSLMSISRKLQPLLWNDIEGGIYYDHIYYITNHITVADSCDCAHHFSGRSRNYFSARWSDCMRDRHRFDRPTFQTEEMSPQQGLFPFSLLVR